MRRLTLRTIAVRLALVTAAAGVAMGIDQVNGILRAQSARETAPTSAPTTTIHPAFRPQPTFDDPVDDTWDATTGTIESLIDDEADQADACESAESLRESARRMEETANRSRDPIDQARAEMAAEDAWMAGDFCVSQLEENADIYGERYMYEDPRYDRPEPEWEEPQYP